jgi:hypothetical protein
MPYKSSLFIVLSKHTAAIAAVWVMSLIIGVVDAQLYQACQDSTSEDGTPAQTCLVDRPSPLTYTAADGTGITLGEISFVIVICIPTVPGTVDTCGCLVVVNPSDPFVETDLCDSCTITAISDTEFDNVFDCSNRLPAGPCVGLDTGRNCISSAGVVPVTPAPVTVPAPVPVVVSTPVPVDESAPEPVPVAEVLTPAPVDKVPTSDECPGKGKGKKKGGKDKKGKDKGDSEGKGKGKGKKDCKDKKKKDKKYPKETKVPKAGKGGKGKGEERQ